MAIARLLKYGFHQGGRVWEQAEIALAPATQQTVAGIEGGERQALLVQRDEDGRHRRDARAVTRKRLQIGGQPAVAGGQQLGSGKSSSRPPASRSCPPSVNASSAA